MGFGDIFKASKNKSLETENKELSNKVSELEALLTPEVRDYANLLQLISQKQQDLHELETKIEKEKADGLKSIDEQRTELMSLHAKIKNAQAVLIQTEDEVLYQSFGLYNPCFEFSNSSDYKDKLGYVRQRQKEMLKAGTAATGSTTWTVNGKLSEGRKMVSDTQKLLLRAFNCECDDVIEHVKFSNIDASEKRIYKAAEAISKLGKTMSISLSDRYTMLKLDELHLAYEYQVKKQEEKERLRQLKAEERERVKVEKEIAEARKRIEKEQSHYQNALHALLSQIENSSEADKLEYEKKRQELEQHLGELSKSMEEIDYREANQRAGYVYVISNIGAFGEDVYKIGMTRRLDPMERVDELGDASVPFNFDVHAMIFSDDAPALEAALHRAFENRKLNMINTRREFFAVSLDEIKAVVKENYDKTVEFIDIAPAEQYRESQLIREKNSVNHNEVF